MGFQYPRVLFDSRKHAYCLTPENVKFTTNVNKLTTFMVNSTVYWIVLASLYNCFIKKHEKLSYLSLRLWQRQQSKFKHQRRLSLLSLSLFLIYSWFIIQHYSWFIIQHSSIFCPNYTRCKTSYILSMLWVKLRLSSFKLLDQYLD